MSFGVWRRGALSDVDFARTVEDLGYASLWLGGVTPADLDRAEEMLDATSTLVVASGIVNIWTIEPSMAASWFHRAHAAHPGRVVLGVGAGHREASGEQAATPFQALESYLDALDAAGVPAERMVLAALGPRAVRLSRDRTGGAHPYLTPAAHTRATRELLGTGPLLVPEQHAALGSDPEQTAATARDALTMYLGLTNYRTSWLRLGFTEDDLAGGGSDALVDALVARGSAEEVARRLREHLEAGADQVVVQVLGDTPVEDLTALAKVLDLNSA